MIGMNEITTLALAGHLVAPADGAQFACTITNQLGLPLDAYVVKSNARQIYRRTIPAGEQIHAKPNDGAHWVLRCAPTGAFVCVIAFSSGQTSYVIDDASLGAPNDIGPLPQPNSQMVVPCASQSLMVGCGRLPTDNFCCREQFWSLVGKSYCLAVGETSTVNSTLTTGVQSTSSSEQTVSASVTGSAHAGWGVSSASISASLQGSNTVNQQLSISAQTTRYLSDKLENKGSSTVMVLMWQLRDIVYVYDRKGQQLASIDQSQNPILTASPVDPGALQPPPAAVANLPDIAAALAGTLTSPADPPSQQWFQFSIQNRTEIPIFFRQVFPDGTLSPPFGLTATRGLPPGHTQIVDQGYAGEKVLIVSSVSGAFVTVLTLDGPATYTIAGDAHVAPNNIGSPPQAGHVLIPTDSQRVLVGSGRLRDGSLVTREQYWRRSDDSFVIGAGETRTASTTTTVGMQQTTSSLSTVSASVDTSATAGWGPVSASVSASLNATSTAYQQLDLTSESTSYVSNTIDNGAGQTAMAYMRWQLMDVITMFGLAIEGQDPVPSASIITGQQPLVLSAPYDPSQLPPAPERDARTRTRARLRVAAS
jgi:hypothetical protein